MLHAHMPMEGFQQYPNLRSLGLLNWKVWAKTKRFELGHLGLQILRSRASKCPHCCHPSINRPRGSNWGIWAFKSCDGEHQNAPIAAILRSTDQEVRWRTCLPCMKQIWTTGSLQEVKNKNSRRTTPKPKRIAAYVSSHHQSGHRIIPPQHDW